MRGHSVRVDVVDIALRVAAEAGHDGDVALFEQVVYRLDVYVGDVADVAEGGTLRLGLYEPAVYAADAHGLAAGRLDEVDEALADLAGEHHLHDVYRVLIRHAQAVHELGLDAVAAQGLVYLGPAAVHEHHLDAYELQQHDVLHDLGLELLVLHGVPAVLDDDDAVPVLLDVGQGLYEHLRPLAF